MTPAPVPAPHLFSAFVLRTMRLGNRVVISPMQMYIGEQGVAGDRHFQHLAKFAVGRTGMVIAEALASNHMGAAPCAIWALRGRVVDP